MAVITASDRDLGLHKPGHDRMVMRACPGTRHEVEKNRLSKKSWVMRKSAPARFELHVTELVLEIRTFRMLFGAATPHRCRSGSRSVAQSDEGRCRV